MEAVRLKSDALPGLADLLAERLGLHYPEHRYRDLAHKVARLARAVGFSSPDDCLDWLMSDPNSDETAQRLISVCTVGETYFFREPDAIDRLTTDALPLLLAAIRVEQRPLRVWSAGCCTGEEPYTIAMALLDAYARYGRFSFEVYGTDVNSEFLARARLAQYRRWSFRNTPQAALERYFTGDNKGFKVVPLVRDAVRFEVLNLSDSHYSGIYGQPKAFDAIFCRNVLMYFTPEATRRALAQLRRALRPGGWLVVSATESSILNMPEFCRKNLPPYAASNAPGRAPAAPAMDETAEYAPEPTETPIFTFIEPEPLTATPEEDLQPAPEAPPVVESDLECAMRLEYDGKYAEALALLRDSAELDDNAAAQLVLARLYQSAGDPASAAAWCVRVIEIDPLNPTAHRLLASVRRESGDTQGALDALKRALYLDPDDAAVHMQLGFIYSQLGHEKMYRRHFRNAAGLFDAFAEQMPLPELGDLTPKRLAEIASEMARNGATP